MKKFFSNAWKVAIALFATLWAIAGYVFLKGRRTSGSADVIKRLDDIERKKDAEIERIHKESDKKVADELKRHTDAVESLQTEFQKKDDELTRNVQEQRDALAKLNERELAEKFSSKFGYNIVELNDEDVKDD